MEHERFNSLMERMYWALGHLSGVQGDESAEVMNLIQDMWNEIDPPAGFSSWKDAAIKERLRRIEYQHRLEKLEK